MIKQLFRWCSLALTLSTTLTAETTDPRLAPLKDYNGYFPFTVPATTEAWQMRRAQLRQQLQVTLGLFPLPARTPLQAVIHSRKDMGDYFLEKAYFQSLPGVYVTGSLYRPKSATGKGPGVLCPHGHWNNGRFLEEPDAGVKEAIASGAEELTCAARSPLQARCVHLARMGCVVFHYDMLGYADGLQVSFETAHKFAAQAKATPGGFFTAESEGNLINIMGLQTWNGIRALDFLESLPDVDSKRLGVTGASGGGTQTFLLCAVDDRPAAAFPAVMVSTAMQGGCTCENASLLRIGTGNVEMAALFAPKPLGMTCAKDWTVDMPTKGLPELQQLYKMLGKPDLVSLTDTRPHGHNYNRLSRVGMEQWFAKHLLNGATAPPEKEFTFQTAKDLTVWDAEHPAPATGPAAERSVVQAIQSANTAALAASPETLLTGWQTILGRTLATTGNCVYKLTGDKIETTAYFKITGEVRNEAHSEIVPVTFLHPKAWRNRVVIWASEKGSAGLFGADGQPVADVQALLDKGWAVAGPDLLLQSSTPATRNRKVENPREAAAFTYGYNSPLLAQRVHDLLSVIKMVQTNPDYKTEKLALAAGPGGTALTAAVAAMAGDTLTACSYDESSFSFSKIASIYDVNFLPGALKYGDIPALTRLVKQKCPMDELREK
jgi:dienelactone hydrolase